MVRQFTLVAITCSLLACGVEGRGVGGHSNSVNTLPAASASTVAPQAVESQLIDPIAQNAVGNGSSAYQSAGSGSTTLRSSALQKVSLRQLPANVNMCAGAITHTESVAIPAVAKPPFRKFYRDPAFGSTVIRITDSREGEVRKPPYSTMQAWNADESYLLLYKGGRGDGYHVIYDGHQYQPIQQLDIIPSDLEEVWWSHTDPDKFFYLSGFHRDIGTFKQYSVSAKRSTVIADFSQYCGKRGEPTGGGDVHMQSHDDDLFGFRCQRDDNKYIMLSYRVSTGEVKTQLLGDGTEWHNWSAPMATPSGKRFWLQGDVLASDMKTIERKMDMAKASEHSSLGRTHDGQDALFQVVFDPSPGGCNGDAHKGVGHLVEHNLETGGCRPIISETQGYPYTTSSTHASAVSYLRPGWVAMSSIGRKDQFDYFKNNRKAPALLSEIYLANTDPDNPVTCRLAHHRSYGKSADRGGYHSYFGEPHATISPSGTRIIFGSDWYDSGAVDSYVIELPGYQRP